MKKIYLILAILLPVLCSGQYVFNAAFQNVKFGGTGVTITPKVSNGTTAGSVVLYQNVVNIGGQQIDAIIRTVSVSAGASMVFDQAGTGTGYTNNNPTWFSPQFLFPAGGGNAIFEFEFILGNSYNNTTNTGTTITLQNMMINSYDIDGNDNIGSNQFSEFGGFSTSEVSTTTTMTTSYNSASNLTQFLSSTYSNVVDASDPNTRVRVSYEEMSIFRISVGSQGQGVAYFFIDFDKGIDFTTPTKVTTAPTVDLNTSSSGNNNAGSQCSNTNMKFTNGAQNINSVLSTPSNGTTLERIKLTIPTTDIKDGSSERLVINGATSGSPIQLDFLDAAVINQVVLTGTTYNVTATVINGESSLIFMKNGSATMTLAEGEKLVDAFYYRNNSSPRTTGTRTFKLRVKDGAYESAGYTYTVSVGTTPSISQQPQSKVIPANSNTTFSVTSTGTSFQWQVNTGSGWNDISDNSTYSGATTATLSITGATQAMNNYQYRAITNPALCSLNSNAATLSVLTILPVKWLNVSGMVQNAGIIIKWGTAQEINSKNFTIQHSIDGKSFANIGTTASAGNTKTDNYYSFIHTSPVAGNNYYRIQQTDADGNSTYSKIIMVVYGDAASVSVLGNPVSNGQLLLQVNQPSSIALFSADGKMVKQLKANAGTHHINVTGLAKGMYTLLAGTTAQRVIINN